MKTSDFEYELPQDLIAQNPIEPRDSSRLFVLHREKNVNEHLQFKDLGNYLNKGDLLVLNETRVIPARLYGHKKTTGGRVEILLLNRRESHIWEVVVGGKSLNPGKIIQFEDNIEGKIIKDLGGSRRLIRFGMPLEPVLDQIGHVPLPPYIHDPLERRERYQTVYAQEPGSAAAPTAGLHFTNRLLDELKNKGVKFGFVILHVGLDTFAPVHELDPREHHIHTEWCLLPQETADLIHQTKAAGGKVIAVGTTSVRTLETAGTKAEHGEIVKAFEGPTDLYILPGYQFQVVDAIITNFHLPRSTLIMLVSAFASQKRIFDAYEVAKRAGYRFYSFGDAMLIL